MRTLLEMIARVRRHLRDHDAGNEWSDDEIESGLSDAYRMLWVDLQETSARNLLRTVGAAVALVADQEEYDIPEDCLRVVEVQWRKSDADEWRPLEYGEKRPDVFRLGSESLFGGGVPSCQPLRWTMRSDSPGTVLVHPALSGTSAGEQIRFVYHAIPVFPFVEAGTFKAPDGESPATYSWIPELADMAAEYCAAALLGGEELDDVRQESVFWGRYLATVQRIGRSSGVRFRPPRRYIKHTSSRRS